jgi:hypothetical protein
MNDDPFDDLNNMLQQYKPPRIYNKVELTQILNTCISPVEQVVYDFISRISTQVPEWKYERIIDPINDKLCQFPWYRFRYVNDNSNLTIFFVLETYPEGYVRIRFDIRGGGIHEMECTGGNLWYTADLYELKQKLVENLKYILPGWQR